MQRQSRSSQRTRTQSQSRAPLEPRSDARVAPTARSAPQGTEVSILDLLAQPGVTAGRLPYAVDLERAFGEDLGDVDAVFGARDWLDSIQAEAAVHEGAVVFGDTSPDRELVAHEAAHLVQIRKRGPGASSSPSEPGADAEIQADQAADAAVAGGIATGLQQAPAQPPSATLRKKKGGRKGRRSLLGHKKDAGRIARLIGMLQVVPFADTFVLRGPPWSSFDGVSVNQLKRAFAVVLVRHIYGATAAAKAARGDGIDTAVLDVTPGGGARFEDGKVVAPKSPSQAGEGLQVTFASATVEGVFSGQASKVVGDPAVKPTKDGKSQLEAAVLLRHLGHVLLEPEFAELVGPGMQGILNQPDASTRLRIRRFILDFLRENKQFAPVLKELGPKVLAASQAKKDPRAVVRKALRGGNARNTLMNLMAGVSPVLQKALAQKTSPSDQMALACSGIGLGKNAVILTPKYLCAARELPKRVSRLKGKPSVSKSFLHHETGQSAVASIRKGEVHECWRDDSERTVAFIDPPLVYFTSASGSAFVQHVDAYMRDVAVLQDDRYSVQRRAASAKGFHDMAKTGLKWILWLISQRTKFDSEKIDEAVVNQLRSSLSGVKGYSVWAGAFDKAYDKILKEHPKLPDQLLERDKAACRVGLGAFASADNIDTFLKKHVSVHDNKSETVLDVVRRQKDAGPSAVAAVKTALEGLWSDFGSSEAIAKSLLAQRTKTLGLELNLTSLKSALFGLHCMGRQGMEHLRSQAARKQAAAKKKGTGK